MTWLGGAEGTAARRKGRRDDGLSALVFESAFPEEGNRELRLGSGPHYSGSAEPSDACSNRLSVVRTPLT